MFTHMQNAGSTVISYGSFIVKYPLKLLAPICTPIEKFLIGDLRQRFYNPTEFKRELITTARESSNGVGVKSLGCVMPGYAVWVPKDKKTLEKTIDELDGFTSEAGQESKGGKTHKRADGRLSLRTLAFFSNSDEILLADTGPHAKEHRQQAAATFISPKFAQLVLDQSKQSLTETKRIPVHETLSRVIKTALAKGILGVDSIPENTYEVFTRFAADVRGYVSFPFPNLLFKCSSKLKKKRTAYLEYSQKFLESQLDSIVEKLRGTHPEKEGLICKKMVELMKEEFGQDVNIPELLDKLPKDKIRSYFKDGYLTGLPFGLRASDNILDSLKLCVDHLARNPEVVRKLRAEIGENGLFGAEGLDKVKLDTLINECPLLDAWYKECLRFDTSAGVSRYVDQELKISDTVRIPKNTYLLIDLFALNKGDKYWDKPLEFNPERFVADSESKDSSKPHEVNHFPFLPFSAGKRKCPAISITEYMFKTVIGYLVSNFDIAYAADRGASADEIYVSLAVPQRATQTQALR